MNFFNKHRDKIPTNKLPRRLSLYIRILCAGYLLYTAEELIKGDSIAQAETENLKLFFMIAVIMFTVIGVIMFAVSIYNLAIGKYEGGKLDAGYNDYDDEETKAKVIAESVENNKDEAENKNSKNTLNKTGNSLTAIMMQSDLMQSEAEQSGTDTEDDK